MSTSNERQQQPHRKSRLGCRVCKSRKYDEARPVYGNCIHRFPNQEQECVFESTYTASSATRPLGEPSSIAGLGSKPLPSRYSAQRWMELGLFYHYATATAYNFPLCEEPSGFSMWTKSIPSIAFSCPNVFSAILGLSAMHLLSMTPANLSLRAAVHQYIDQVISGQREISSITTENSDSLFATSMLLAIHAKMRSICQATTEERYTPPVDWFHLHLSLRKVARQTLLFINDEHILAYAAMNPKSYSTATPTQVPPIKFPNDAFLSSSHLWDDPSLSSEQRHTYFEALPYLELIESRIIAGESSHWIQRRLAILPGELPEEFAGLLEIEDPLALAIIARFYALFKCVEGVWWMRGTAEFEVRGLAGLVSEEWEWIMRWPLDILEGRIKGGE